MDTNVQLLSAPSFMAKVVDAFDLVQDVEFNPALPGGPRVADWLEDTAVSLVAALPAPAVLAANQVASPLPSLDEQREQTVRQLLYQTRVEQTGEAYTIAIRVTSFDRDKAARLANAMAKRFIEDRLEAKHAAITQAAGWLDTRLAELREQVARSERAVADVRGREGLPQAREDNLVLRQTDQLMIQLVLAEARRGQAEARLQQARALPGARDKAKLATTVFSSPLLVQLQEQEAALAREAAELSTTLGARHPQMLNKKAEIESVRQRADEELVRIVNDVQNEAMVARAEEEQLRRRLNELEAAARQQQTATTPLLELERLAEADRAIYTTFLGRFKEVSEQAEIAVPGVKLVSQAQPPTIPSFPLKSLLVGGSAVSSLAVGVVLAFIVELFDTGMRTARQVEGLLGIPVIAMVPSVSRRRARKQQLHRYLKGNPRSSFADAVRGLKLALRQSNLDRPPKVVLVTSALPQEGKTTLALCLAAAAAEDGMRTVIVDLDLHRPRLRGLLGVAKGTPGVVEHVVGECALEEALVSERTIPGLHALTVYRAAANPSALYVTRRMAEVVQALRREFDLVILDTPPTLAVGDAQILAGLADVVLLVVRWGATRANAAEAGLEKLRDIQTPIIGVALNQVDVRRHAKRVYGDALQYHQQVSRYYRD
jgi:capsular exopolysaccharide synthesis family protein